MSDFKQGKRVRDPLLMRELHRRWDACLLCLYAAPVDDDMGRLSLHHVIPKGSPYFGDDLEENLVMLCGSGTSGHHGLIEAADEDTLALLGRVLMARRPDVLEYIWAKLGVDAGAEWLHRHLKVGAPWI